MKFNFLFVLLLSVVAFVSCKKDEPTESYLRCGNAIINSADGNMIIAGYNYDNTSGFDGYLAKVSTEGALIWANRFGGMNTDVLFGVVKAQGGGYAAAGYRNFSNMGLSRLSVEKVNEAGTSEWHYLATEVSKAFAITRTADDGFIACGYVEDSVVMDRDLYFVKINAQGQKVWEKKYGSKSGTSTTSVFDEAYSIIPDGDSAFYVTGSCMGNASCCGKIFVMKMSAAGDSLWLKTFTTGIGFSIVKTSTGKLIVGGNDNTNGPDACLFYLTAGGEKIWEKVLGSNGYDYGTTAVEAADGGFALCGITGKSSSSYADVSLFKVDIGGTLTWSATYGGDNMEEGYGMLLMPDGGYCITGLSNTDGSYIFLNRTNAAGVELWQKNLK